MNRRRDTYVGPAPHPRGPRPAPRRDQPKQTTSATVIGALALFGGAVVLGLASRRPDRRSAAVGPGPSRRRAARRTRRASALLAGSVLADSALEHYRGNYHRREMYAAPLGATASLAAALSDPPDGERRWPGRVFVAATTIGAVGLAFHLRNLLTRPGGLSWLNLFYAAPVGAPAAMVLAGVYGVVAERIATVSAAPHERRLDDLADGRELATLSTIGLIGTSLEVALLHFRGAFHNPFMYVPIIVPPVTALALADAARAPTSQRLRFARTMLNTTTILGIVGIGFHAFGVNRSMGGWRNWTQNLLLGPPLSAPPSFTGIALAGHGALDLLEAESRRRS